MTDLEQLIYTRGLENLYGSVLLGEDPLNSIENLVCLTRDLVGVKGSRQPISAECIFIKKICAACWPEMELSIQPKDAEMNTLQVKRGAIAEPVCKAIFQVERRGGNPDKVLLWQGDGAICFHVEESGQIVIQGEIRDD